MKCYEEVIDFIASGPSPSELISFRLSKAVNQRAADLIERNKTGDLDEGERTELHHHLELEHIMRLAKARARNNA